MIRLQARAVLKQAGDTAIAGWAWWVGELAALLPANVARYFVGNARFLLRLGSDGMIFEGPDGVADIVASAGPESVLPVGLKERLRQSDAITLLLPAGKVLRRAIDLPLAAASDLASAVPFQIERQTPFRLENANYTFRVLGRDKARKTVRVELAVTAKATLASLRAWLAEREVPVSAVRVDGDDRWPPFVFDTRNSFKRGVWGSSWAREPWKPILAFAVGLAIAGPWATDISLHRQAGRARAAVIDAEVKARAAAKLRAELHDAILADSFLQDRYAAPRAIEVLDAATRALPDDAWVFSLELKAPSLRLTGFSANVPAIVERLRSVAIFRKIEFASPVVRDAANHQDRFEILVQVRQPQNDNNRL